MQDSSLICVCKQKTFSPVLLINSTQKDKAKYLSKLPNRKGILLTTQASWARVWRRSLGGTGGESVRSAGYLLIE